MIPTLLPLATLRSITLPLADDAESFTAMPSPELPLALFSTTTLRSDPPSSRMPVPPEALALFPSMRLSFDWVSSMPLELKRTSLPWIRLSWACSRSMPVEPASCTMLAKSSLPVEPTMMIPAEPESLIEFSSIRLSSEGSPGSPTSMPALELIVIVLPMTMFRSDPASETPAPLGSLM